MRKMTAAVAISVLALTSACSDGSDSDGPVGGSEDVAAAATKALAEKSTAASQIKVPDLRSPAPDGKTINLVTCPIPSCQGIEKGVNEAADALGWTVKTIDGGLTPDSFTSALTTLAKNPGDGVLAPGILPNSAIQTQLASLEAQGVPFVGFSSPSPVGDGMVVNIGTEKQINRSAEMMADWVIADSKGTAKSVLVFDKSYPQTQRANGAFKAEAEKLCPDCETDELATNFTTGIGKAVPEEIVSYLQRNPETGYVVVEIGNATAGVGPAIQAAGLGDKVKVVSRYADQANFSNIKGGLEAMGVTEETYETGWRGVDAIARVVTGTEVDPTPFGVQVVITKDNVPSDLDNPYTVENYTEPFLKAWGLE